VGYTNAWKSTLTNVLTKKWVLQEDKLFATLWTSVWKMFIEASYDEVTNKYIPPKEILINDTIWFIRELPPKLIEAFKSTLEDSIESNLLLHVIDASDPKVDIKINVVDEILKNIWAKQKKIYVFNKIDFLNNIEFIEEIKEKIDWKITISEKIHKNKQEFLKQKYKELNPIFISAWEKIWINELKIRITENLIY
jgi:GTP-binding protein HflX